MKAVLFLCFVFIYITDGRGFKWIINAWLMDAFLFSFCFVEETKMWANEYVDEDAEGNKYS